MTARTLKNKIPRGDETKKMPKHTGAKGKFVKYAGQITNEANKLPENARAIK